ncbi:cytochrome P450 [Aspergillus undulatus]|uniref:cytochrome P450 n=1 Tax=Aspergillus undulatus TaxID=1810928 RepID=UPI003CCE4080
MLSTLALLPLAYGLWLVLHRLWWHPLRKIPGPVLAGLTGWWEFYFDVIEDGTLVKRLPKLHRDYQTPVIRTSPNHVHVNDPDFYHVVYRSGTPYGKAPHFYKALIYPEALITPMDSKRDRVYRNTIAPLFSPAAIELCTPRIQDVIMNAASKIADGLRNNEPLDVQRLYRAISADVIYVTLFGQRDEFVRSYEEDHGLTVAMDKITHGMWLGMLCALLCCILPLSPLTPLLPSKQQCASWVSSVRSRLANGQMTTSDGITTIFDAMLTPSEERGYKERTSKELIDEAALFILAGSDTSAYSLTTATCYLLTNPDALGKLRVELDEAMEDVRGGRWDEVRKLGYLMAVVKETLRLATPVPGITPRIVPEPGVKVQDYFLPAGDNRIHHAPLNPRHLRPRPIPHPTKFQPERWLGEKGKVLDRWLVAFSKGSRQCVGSPLAYQELALTIAHIFSRFEMELYETDKASMEWVDNVVAVNKEPVRVRVLKDRWA